VLRANGGESAGEFGGGEGIFGGEGLEFGVKGGREWVGEERGRGFGEGEVAGLGGGRVHEVGSKLNDTRVKGRGGVRIVLGRLPGLKPLNFGGWDYGRAEARPLQSKIKPIAGRILKKVCKGEEMRRSCSQRPRDGGCGGLT